MDPHQKRPEMSAAGKILIKVSRKINGPLMAETNILIIKDDDWAFTF